MSYTNTPVTTSVSGSWNGTSFDYSSIALIDGIPHDAQLEIERVFTTTRDSLPITDFLNNPLFTAKDKREVFVIPNSRITFNETTKTITAIDLPNTGNVYNYDPVDAGVSDVQVPEIAVSQSLKVRRKSVSNSPLVTWTAGNKLTSNQLNLETKQLLYLTQELIDKVTTETTVSNVAIGDIPDGAVTPTKLSGGHPSWTSGGNFSVDTDVLFVDASNNRVGVNTASPAHSLDIVGTANISSTLGVTGNTTIGGSLEVNSGVITSTNAGATNITIGDPLAGTCRIRNPVLLVDGIIKNAHPCFHVSGANGTNTAAETITWQIEHVDTSSSFNLSTGKFTAPHTGIYFFSGNILGYCGSTAPKQVTYWRFRKNATNYGTNHYTPNTTQYNISYVTVSGSCVVQLNENDTFEMNLASGEVYANYGSFCGYLIR
jgi:hypothetical protein